jgi:hypothetical protein
LARFSADPKVRGCSLQKLFPEPADVGYGDKIEDDERNAAPVVEATPAPAAAPRVKREKKTDKPVNAPKAKSAMSRLKETTPKLPLKDLQAALAAEGYSPAASSIASLRTTSCSRCGCCKPLAWLRSWCSTDLHPDNPTWVKGSLRRALSVSTATVAGLLHPSPLVAGKAGQQNACNTWSAPSIHRGAAVFHIF